MIKRIKIRILNKMLFQWNRMILKDRLKNKKKMNRKMKMIRKIKIQMKKCHKLMINLIISYGMIKYLKMKKKMEIRSKEIKKIQILKDKNHKKIWNKGLNNKKRKDKIKEILMNLKNVVLKNNLKKIIKIKMMNKRR